MVNFQKGFDPRRNLEGRPKKFDAKRIVEEIAAADGTMTFPVEECEITDTEVTIPIGNAEGVIISAFRAAQKGDGKAIIALFKAFGLDKPALVQNIQNNIQIDYNFDLLDKDTKTIVLEALRKCRVGPTEVIS